MAHELGIILQRLVLVGVLVIAGTSAPSRGQEQNKGAIHYVRSGQVRKHGPVPGEFSDKAAPAPVFEVNRGQFPPDVRFAVRSPGALLELTMQAVKVTFPLTSHQSGHSPQTLRLSFVGANATPRVVGVVRQSGVINSLLGQDPHAWRTGIPMYARVAYEQLYPGINLDFYLRGGHVEYDWVIEPGANPRRIQLSLSSDTGRVDASIDRGGDLHIAGLPKPVVQRRLIAYQTVRGQRHPIEARLVLLPRGRLSFEVGPHDRAMPVILDPILDYSTALSSINADGAVIIAAPHDNLLIAGGFDAPEHPANGHPLKVVCPAPNRYNYPGQAGCGGGFITKLDPTGHVVFTTFFGNPATAPRGIGVAPDGILVVAGSLSGANLPAATVAGTGCSSTSCTRAFVAHIDASGRHLLTSVTIGGSATLNSGTATSETKVARVAMDAAGAAYLTGETRDKNFPLLHAVQQKRDCATSTDTSCYTAAFVAKVSADGLHVVYSSYLGGSEESTGTAIAVDASEAAYVAGQTNSEDVPTTTHAPQPACHIASNATSSSRYCVPTGFVVKISSDGSHLVYGTYLGGRSKEGDTITALAVDQAGSAYVTGSTTSVDFPVAAALQPHYGSSTKNCETNSGFVPCNEAFVTKISAQGTALIYSTYLGGGLWSSGEAIAVDDAGRTYVVGKALYPGFPVVGPVPTGPRPDDGLFVTVFNPLGTSLDVSTYLDHTDLNDRVSGVTLTGAGVPCVLSYAPQVSGFSSSGTVAGGGPLRVSCLASVAQTVRGLPNGGNNGAGPTPPIPVGKCPETETLGEWVFHWASCPHNGKVTGVIVQPPHDASSGLRFDRSRVVLPSLAVTAGDRLVRPVQLPDLSAVVAGFPIAARGLTLDTQGLTMQEADLSLPPGITGGSCTSLALTDVHLSPSLHITEKPVVLRSSIAALLFNVSIKANGFALSDDGLTVQDAQATLPQVLLGRTFAIRGLVIHGDGTATSDPSPVGTPPLEVRGMSLQVGHVQVTPDGLAFRDVQAQIPLSPGYFAIDDFTYNGAEIVGGRSRVGAGVPAIPIKGQHISIADFDLTLTLSIENDVFGYLFDGSGAIYVPFVKKVGGIAAHVVIGSITALHPDTLRTVELAVTPGVPIPLGESGLGITRIKGRLDITHQGQDVAYTFGLRGEVETLPDNGKLLSGYLHGAVSTDGNVSVGGGVSLLQLAQLRGTLCLRVQAGDDHVCDVLGHYASDATGTGAYVAVDGRLDVPNNGKHIHLTGAAYAHIWTATVADASTTPVPVPSSGLNHGQPPPVPLTASPTTPPASATHQELHLYGDAHFRAQIDRGYFVTAHIDLFGLHLSQDLLPPCGVDVQDAALSVGTFAHGDRRVDGFKGSITGYMSCSNYRALGVPAHIPYAAHIFFEPPTSVVVGNDVDALYQQLPDNASALVHGAPAGRAVGMAPDAARNPTTMQPAVVRRVRVVPGQTSTFFTIGWVNGGPTLEVVAPDGTTYRQPRTPAQFVTRAGRDTYWFQSQDPRLLTPGTRAATALYVVRPQPGLWIVRVRHLQHNDRVHLAVTGYTPGPTLSVAIPRKGQVVAVSPQVPRVLIAGSVRGATRGDSVGLYYTTVPTVVMHGRRLTNLAGTVIVAAVPIHHGTWRYLWDTRGASLPRGTYYIYAVLNNGVGPEADAYSAGVVRVLRHLRPGAPRRVRGIRSGRRLTVTWLAPTASPAVAGYIVYVRDRARHGAHYDVYLGNVRSFVLSNVDPRARYIVTVSAYDLSGAMSVAVPAQVRTVAPPKRVAPHHARKRLGRRSSAGTVKTQGAVASVRIPVGPNKYRQVVLHSRSAHTLVDQAASSDDYVTVVHTSNAFRGAGRGRIMAFNHALVRSGRGVSIAVHIPRANIHLLSPPAIASCSINRLANTSYASRRWRLPGTSRTVVVGELTGREFGFRSGAFYGYLDFAYTGDPHRVLISVDDRVKYGTIQRDQYYNEAQDRVGRATGVVAVLTPDTIKGEGSKRKDLYIDPPGFETLDVSTGQRLSRGHLLGDNLGGVNDTGRNFVTLFLYKTNTPLMRDEETDIADALRNGEVDTVFYQVTPRYPREASTNSNIIIPYAVDLEAIGIGKRPLYIHVRITNNDHATLTRLP